MITLSIGLFGLFENPVTTVRPRHYRNFDLNAMMHSVVHEHHPDIIENFESINALSQNLVQTK